VVARSAHKNLTFLSPPLTPPADKLSTFLVFVAIFYAILIMQKSTMDSFDVHDIIHNSLMNLEWETVDDIGANPGEALTDNVWNL
jgi:hypothetical protein